MKKEIVMKYQILYNPKSNNGRGSEEAENAIGRLNEKKKPGAEIVRKDITSIDIKRYIQNETAADDIIVICGGDGTLSRFINDTDGMEINRRIDYYATGTGNDFFRDLGLEKGDIAEDRQLELQLGQAHLSLLRLLDELIKQREDGSDH